MDLNAKKSLKTFSIKWKLSLALILTGLGLVIVYVLIAKNVFEKDKISYVFDSQRSGLTSLNREIASRLRRTIFTARGLLASVDSSGKIAAAGMELFQEDKSLLAIQIWNDQSKASEFLLEKKSGSLPPITIKDLQVDKGEVKLFAGEDQNFLFVLRPNKDPGIPLFVRILVDVVDILPENELRQPILLLKDQKILSSIGITGYQDEFIQGLVQKFGQDNEDVTTLWQFGSERFLVSSSFIGLGELKIMTFTPEAEALGALNTLFSRSLVFLAFSTFGLIAISLVLSAGLTSNLQILTRAAQEIGDGNFDDTPAIKSRDEMGILSLAFQKMAFEIKRLLLETRDKARMEAELKTAKLVQESLLPANNTFEMNSIEISGIALTSTECGGDWWYYFVRDDDLYVVIADATGHGTPAALITAAARSVFSRLESESLSLEEMMRAWDFAVSSCSQRRVFMTGILLKVNSKTGQGSYLSAGHESPYLFDLCDDVFAGSVMDLDIHPALGEGGLNNLQVQNFELKENSSLVLYTDGLFSVEPEDGKKLSEKRLVKAISGKLPLAPDAKRVTSVVLSLFEEHRKNLPLPDDVMVVSLRRKGPPLAMSSKSEAILFNIS